jgi:hypothetical protein
MRLNQHKDTKYFISDDGQVYINNWIQRLANPTIYKTEYNTYQSTIRINKIN